MDLASDKNPVMKDEICVRSDTFLAGFISHLVFDNFVLFFSQALYQPVLSKMDALGTCNETMFFGELQ